MLALRRAATRVVELTDMLLLSLIAVTAGRTGPLRFCVAMVGPGPQEARNLVEQVVGQVQGMLPEGLELVATIARYEPGMDVRSLVDAVGQPSCLDDCCARHAGAPRAVPPAVRIRTPSRGSSSLSLAGDDGPGRLQLGAALLLGLVLVASGLYLWRRPRSADASPRRHGRGFRVRDGCRWARSVTRGSCWEPSHPTRVVLPPVALTDRGARLPGPRLEDDRARACDHLAPSRRRSPTPSTTRPPACRLAVRPAAGPSSTSPT